MTDPALRAVFQHHKHKAATGATARPRTADAGGGGGGVRGAATAAAATSAARRRDSRDGGISVGGGRGQGGGHGRSVSMPTSPVGAGGAGRDTRGSSGAWHEVTAWGSGSLAGDTGLGDDDVDDDRAGDAWAWGPAPTQPSLGLRSITSHAALFTAPVPGTATAAASRQTRHSGQQQYARGGSNRHAKRESRRAALLRRPNLAAARIATARRKAARAAAETAAAHEEAARAAAGSMGVPLMHGGRASGRQLRGSLTLPTSMHARGGGTAPMMMMASSPVWQQRGGRTLQQPHKRGHVHLDLSRSRGSSSRLHGRA